ncbi:hypothetical protein PGT21_027894 [Puccinia graminis f. sp. tritici]|uniref:Uncharacterized protein n=1 Tax=Puccinia graminis f. sp. tritici TaxID=56615 RepID=A0A5B0NQH4_PUCGR|nr:hypothetical protein PGTUg99_019498 [Puccinia graminis f. sp. tritici]KAA1091183.1 hypothetical protein PGT21_027894 [Puccinia graminis f. sp. tritici]
MKHIWLKTPVLLVFLLEVSKMSLVVAHQCPMLKLFPDLNLEPHHIDTITISVDGYRVRYHKFRCNLCDATWSEQQWKKKEPYPPLGPSS